MKRRAKMTRKGQIKPTQPRYKYRRLRAEWEEMQQQWMKLISINVYLDDKVKGNHLSSHFGDRRQSIKERLEIIEQLMMKASAHFRWIRDTHSDIILSEEEAELLQQEWQTHYGPTDEQKEEKKARARERKKKK